MSQPKEHGIVMLMDGNQAQRIAELERVASNNADWFNQLVHDLATIYKCEEKPSAVIQAAKDREQQLATAALLLERIEHWSEDWSHKHEIQTFLATVREQKKGQP